MTGESTEISTENTVSCQRQSINTGYQIPKSTNHQNADEETESEEAL